MFVLLAPGAARVLELRFHEMTRALILSVFAAATLTAFQAERTDDQRRLRADRGPNGHTLVVIAGGEFTMGAPAGERGRTDEEVAHRVRIPRTYAIGTTEVTNEQWERFLAAVPEYDAGWRARTKVRFDDPPRFAKFSRTPDSPQVARELV